MASLRSTQGQARAFGAIADGAKVLDELEARAASEDRSRADRLADELRLEGAHMVLDAQTGAMKAGLPPTT